MNKMSGMKKAIGGSIHRIREFELEKVISFLPHSLTLLNGSAAIGFSFVHVHFPKVLRFFRKIKLKTG